MKTFVALALGATALAAPQAASPPAGCQASVSGTFQINTVLAPAKRDLESRQLSGTLTLTLQNGILKDQAGRTGYIASNYQFQFDNPVQAGARETSGFSLCSNGSLALSGSRPYGAAVWWQCNSGAFFNLYSTTIGNQCQKIFITAVNQGGSPQASQIPDGQPQASSAKPAVTQIGDGQPQASSAKPAVTQIADGQPQAASAKPAVSQIADGQPQAPSAKPAVSQIADGQPQAPSAKPAVTQISDGQPQAPSAKPAVTQISDGQPQAPSAKPAVSQISDGQPQAPSARPANATVSRPAPSQFTGAAATGSAAAGAFAAGLFGLLAML